MTCAPDAFETGLQLGGKGAGAEAVDDQTHGDATIGRRRQCVADAQADVVLGKDVRLEINGACGAVDRRQEMRKELVAVLQQADAVAAVDQRTRRDLEARAPESRPHALRHATSRSAISGMWSERCAHSMPLGTLTSWTLNPRT